MSKLLEEPPQTGRPKKLEIETIAKIQNELSEPEGFNSYKEIKLWLSVCQDIEISYPTIHRIVRYELKGKLKVPRPTHEKQQPGVIEAFKNYFPDRIKGLINDIRGQWENKFPISYWFQDETRSGTILLFQPPYCPELNPIERVWQYIKQKLKNIFFTSLDDVKHKVANILNSLSKDIIHSLTGWQYILDALSL